MSKVIAVQPYLVIERVIADRLQTTVEHKHELRLFETRITSFRREFPLQTVHDISFKIVSGNAGFLYFHTNQGVYPFLVRTDPELFIKAYRDRKF